MKFAFAKFVLLVLMVNNWGIKPLSEAMLLQMMQMLTWFSSKPQATPPVAKIMDYGKFKFISKETKKNNVRNKALLPKEVPRLSPVIDKVFETKLRNGCKFFLKKETRLKFYPILKVG